MKLNFMAEEYMRIATNALMKFVLDAEGCMKNHEPLLAFDFLTQIHSLTIHHLSADRQVHNTILNP